MSPLSDDALERLRRAAEWPDLSGTPYKIEKKIASGGMGTVFLARDHKLNRTVALKVLTLPDGAGQLPVRMLREAKILAQLEHPGIVPVHDVGSLPDGRLFYTMKFVEGDTLETYREKSPGQSDLLRIFQRVCEAAAFAHSKGVIHRDLKPSNIMVGSFGEVLVMDWGIAALLESGSKSDSSSAKEKNSTQNLPGTIEPITAHGTVLGTPAYMSPEQAAGRSGQVDHRTDIYSLGALLYFILTGRAPFEGTLDEIRNKVARGDFVPPRSVMRQISRRLEAICKKGMALKPEKRYPSAEKLSQDISLFMDDEPVSAYRENFFEIAGRWVNRNRFIVWLVLGYVLLRLLILIFYKF